MRRRQRHARMHEQRHHSSRTRRRAAARRANRLPAPGSMAPAETLQLVWHGRRRVPGVMPGEWLTVRGRVTQMDGVPTLHNPEFDLVDAPEATL
ncbi:hypothetical protein [Micrococcus sp. HSID17227]|uniref:hypothetical protein n=1 Tax=Micrococcus sp. HSID17227 TaxID=2419506 RepID=UPI001EE8616B|nr:hypothetical protein [Micrococcus sp. HSID17227]